MTAAPELPPTLEQITPPDADRETFLAARRRGLGSSDVAALIGADPYRTSLTVYLEKTTGESYRDDGEDDEESGDVDPDARYWGTVLEAPVAEHFARANHSPLLPAGTYARHGWQLASPDRLIVGFPSKEPTVTVPYLRPVAELTATNMPDGEDPTHLLYEEVEEAIVGGYEGKTASAYLSDEWKAGLVPDRYLVQVYWQMHVLGLPYVWIAALIGGQRYVQVRVDRDQEFIDDLVTLAARFWFDHIESRVPPTLVGEPVRAALDLVKSMHPVSIAESRIDLGNDFLDLVRTWQEHKAWERAHNVAGKAYEVLIREAIGDAEFAYVGGEKVLRASNIAPSTYTVNRKAGRRLNPAAAVKMPTPELEIPTRKELP